MNGKEDTPSAVAAAIHEELVRSGFPVDLHSVTVAMGRWTKPRTEPGPHLEFKNSVAEGNKKLKAIRRAREILQKAELPDDSLDALENQVSFVHHMRVALLRDQLDSQGGTNWPAREVAGIVMTTFLLLGADVTFGVMPTGSEPSTAYGRAVKAALRHTDPHAHWRNAAQYWVKELPDCEQELLGARSRKDALFMQLEADRRAAERDGFWR